MRNATIALSASQTKKVGEYRETFGQNIGALVEVNYVKRDGSASVLSGKVMSVVGAADDKAAVTVATDKGPRSANLWAVESFSIAPLR